MSDAHPLPAANTPVALTGGAGFVGRHVLNALLNAGRRVRTLDHTGKLMRQLMNKPPEHRERVEIVPGGLFDDAALAKLVEGCAAVVHLVGIIRERPGQGVTFNRLHHQAVEKLLGHAQQAGVPRWLHMSALGTRADAVSDYHRSKWRGEQAVRDSAMQWTIFRPSLIHGPDGELMQMLKRFCRGLVPPCLPYFGPGIFGRGEPGRLQPVYVKDVATLFEQAIDREITIGKTYAVGGPDVVTWPAFYKAAAKYIGCTYPKSPVPVPVWFAKAIAAANLPGMPFNRSQIIMSQENSTCDVQPLLRDFEIELSPRETSLAVYGGRM